MDALHRFASNCTKTRNTVLDPLRREEGGRRKDDGRAGPVKLNESSRKRSSYTGGGRPVGAPQPSRALGTGDRNTLHPVRSSQAGALHSAAGQCPPLHLVLRVGCCQHAADGTIVPWLPSPRPGRLHLELSGDEATRHNARTSSHTRR